ncbi:MAG TPA: hypothetical protein PK405_06490 [Hyphomicrobiales bacterium]|nr:hypothetical protein [Rhodobiaceae bacterium]HXK54316.1 hypothetical protein [Hyphomicrobiales bacterium]
MRWSLGPVLSTTLLSFLLPLAAATAQPLRDPGSRAELLGSPPGTVQVDANYLAPSPCHYVAGTTLAPPPGASMPKHAVALTIVVATRPGGCTRQPTVLREMTNVFPDLDTNLVKVFFVSASGKSLKTEQIPISGL